MEYDFYVAGPFFNNKERTAVDAVVNKLREMNYKIYSPKEYIIPWGKRMPNEEWARKVFDEDINAIMNSQAIIALNWGMYSDSGTAWEIGFAFGIEKDVYTIFCNKNISNVYSLMCVNSSFYFSTLENFLKSDDFSFGTIYSIVDEIEQK